MVPAVTVKGVDLSVKHSPLTVDAFCGKMVKQFNGILAYIVEHSSLFHVYFTERNSASASHRISERETS